MAENSVIEAGRLVYAKCHTIGGWTGALTAANMNAVNQVVAAVRNVGPADLEVDSIDFAFATTAQATTQLQSIAFAAYKVPGFTALASTGARATPPVPVRKRIADHIALPTTNTGDPKFDTAVQVQVGATGPLTGLTVSPAILFDDPIAVFVPRTQMGGTITIYDGDKRWAPHDWVPLTLGPDEGIVWTSRLVWPTGLAGQFFAGAEVRLA